MSTKQKSVKQVETKIEEVNPKLVSLEEQNNQATEPVVEVKNEEEILRLEGEIVKVTEQLKEMKSALRKLNGVGATRKEGPSKMDKAKAVFVRMMEEKKERKDIILAFISEVELTKAGAATYYAILKNKQ